VNTQLKTVNETAELSGAECTPSSIAFLYSAVFPLNISILTNGIR